MISRFYIFRNVYVFSACALLIALFLACSAIWLAMPYMADDAIVRLEKRTPVRIYYDGSGNVISVERTYDYQKREHIPLEQVSPCFIDAVLAAEDSGFWNHGGVSYRAILRAAITDIVNGRIVSGASTVTMQLASLDRDGRKKTFTEKFVQIAEARKLEKLYDKRRILEEYVNRIPFGGKIYGIQAAARYYFGKSASELNVAEASLLAGLPQSPNRYRPDRHFERARQRQWIVLLRMEKKGKIRDSSAAGVFNMPLYMRDFTESSFYMENHHPEMDMMLRHARQEAENAFEIRTSLDMALQKEVSDVLKEYRNRTPDVKDGACVVLKAGSSKVLAMVGTLNFYDPIDGQVNAASAVRSAGSTLKPFIYAEAIDGGIIAEDTILRDAPLSYGTYSPANYDGTFQGNVRASSALSRSLNTPVIRLLERLGTERVLNTFAELGLVSPEKEDKKQIAKDKGLTIALGTAGHSLLQLAGAYSVLAGNGKAEKVSFLLDGDADAGQSVFSEPCAVMVSRMLRQSKINGIELDAAWKTGTSNGLRDAWCVAYTGDYVVAVWFGNKSGSASSYLVGSKLAAPCAGRILSMLHEYRAPEWREPENFLKREKLCRTSGMPAESKCENTFSGWTMPGFSLPSCNMCGRNIRKPLNIVSPRSTVYLAKDNAADIPLDCRENALWFVDGNYIGAVEPGASLLFAPGSHKVRVVSPDDSRDSVAVEFTVKL